MLQSHRHHSNLYVVGDGNVDFLDVVLQEDDCVLAPMNSPPGIDVENLERRCCLEALMRDFGLHARVPEAVLSLPSGPSSPCAAKIAVLTLHGVYVTRLRQWLISPR